MSTLRGLDQNFECAEKHLEFAIENNHEILEKLDYLSDSDEKYEFITLVTKVNQALRQVYTAILDFKVKIKQALNNENASESSNENILNYIKATIPMLRKKLRVSRKAYQQLKEYCLSMKATESDKDPLFWDALIGEIADGRGNIYAAEKHLTEIVLDVEKRISTSTSPGEKNQEK